MVDVDQGTATGRGFALMTFAVNGFLCVAALLFPFSVAATNAALGTALVLSVISGLWWRGAIQCWQKFRSLSIAFLAYFTFLLVGLAWSQDLGWGMHIIGRQWFWLLAPAMAMSLQDQALRRYFLISLSAGLSLNLLFCVLQSFGYVNVATVAGSSADNATGHIGHIGFGFVYGIWAAWLLLMGLRSAGKLRWLYWCLSCWSYIMIFGALGRSGYVISLVLAIAVMLKWFSGRVGWKHMMSMLGGILILFSMVMTLGPARERMLGGWLAVTGSYQNSESFLQKNGRDALQQRFDMWITTLGIYRAHPVWGVGTGGLPGAVAALKSEGKSTANFLFVHPHNQYLLALVRWGPVGLLLLGLMLVCWMREGWQNEWHVSESAPLFFLPALALAIHGLSSIAIEEHFSAMLSVLLLGVALSCEKHTKQKSPMGT